MSDRLVQNPFHVLGLPVTCTRAEAEREGQKLLGMLSLGLAQAATYATPLGSKPRTAELVRWAMAELRDPQARLGHELWAQLPAVTPASDTTDAHTPADEGPPGWPDAPTALGWRPR